MKFAHTAASLALLSTSANAVKPGPVVRSRGQGPAIQVLPRQLPAEPQGVKTITSPNGATISYKEPGKEGVCETTPGVNSYSGFVNLGEDIHSFFYFFESRRDPANDPLTLWLNGGPGSDSLIGLFQGMLPMQIISNVNSCRAWTMQRDGRSGHRVEPVRMERGLQHALPIPACRRWLQLFR